MKREIAVNNRLYKMGKISADTYMDYLELAEKIEAATASRPSRRYSRNEIAEMAEFVCEAYGNQFTPDELKDVDTGLDAAGIIIEFNMIEAQVAEEMSERMDKMIVNFPKSK
ncbi:MAG: hypothetical protein LUE96_07290 [Lachnospiraceae bacterium]|nr:hypothetical protein [Lachnospiraceae bacterium]